MFGISKIQGWIAAGAIAILIAMGGYIYVSNIWHENALEAKEVKIRSLVAEVTAERVGHAVTKRTLENISISLDVMRIQRNILESKMFDAEKDITELRRKFDGHDLDDLSRRKPGLIENIINKATQEVFDEFEEITDPATFN